MPAASPLPFRPLRPRWSLWLLAIAALAGSVECGKKGPPLPPLRILPRPVEKVLLRQIGEDVVLTATVSLSRTDGSPLGAGSSVQILRMTPGPTLRPSAVSARYLMVMFLKEAKPVASLTGDELHRAVASGRLVFHDRAPSGTAQVSGLARAAPRYLYAGQVVDERGQHSLLSVPQEIQLATPPASPAGLKVDLAEGEVRLSWESGVSEPKEELYNVYRREVGTGEESLVPLNVGPITERVFVDTQFQYGETYRYSVRSLQRTQQPWCESVPGPEVEAHPVDVYAPKTPTGLAAAVEGRTIKLYWFPNSEPDLHGYRIYRREEKGSFQTIGEADASEPSFADPTPKPGVRYYYAVTAVDGAQPSNESGRSDEVSEILPADAQGPPGGMGRRR